MALVNVPTVTSATGSKQIVVRAPSGGGVMYTVPTGKTFTGYAMLFQGSQAQVNINGIEIASFASTTPYWAVPMPLTLVAGTVVSSGSSYVSWAIYGVES